MKENKRHILGHKTKVTEKEWEYKFVYKTVKA